jgi:hypothetical protein
MKNSDTICAYLTLTIFIQLIGLAFYMGTNPQGYFYIFIFIILLFFAVLQFLNAPKYKKMYFMVTEPPEFDSDWIDCYVRVTGEISNENSILPINGKECTFYTSSVVAEWKTKMKKPGKGLMNHWKTLFYNRSPDDLKLKVNNQFVFIVPEMFSHSMTLNEIKKVQNECPAPIKMHENEKYKTYSVKECFLQKETTITAQGKLIQKKDGRLFIQPTGILEYPSFALVHKNNNVEKFINELAEKAEYSYYENHVRAFFFALNAVFLGCFGLIAL